MGFCEPCGRLIPEYQWKSHVQGQKHAAAVRLYSSEDSGPKCQCHFVPSVRRVCQKQNENQGRAFFTCRKNNGCSFFQWEDAPHLQSQEVSGGGKYGASQMSAFTTSDCIIKVTLNPNRASQHRNTPLPDLDLSSLKVNLTILPSVVQLKFKFNRQFIDLLKDHVEGRQWDPTLKVWTVPKKELPVLVKFLQHFKINVTKTALTAAKKVDANTIEISLEPSGSAVAVSFPYNLTIVSIIKQLHPTQRQYDRQAYKWAVRIEAIDDLVGLFETALHEDDDIIRLVTPHKNKLEALKEQVERNGAVEKDKSTDHDHQQHASDEDDSKPPGQNQHPNCICERPREMTNDQHVCRLFAKFTCVSCNNSWSTAYCWYHPETDSSETQDCRKCGAANSPIDKRPRNKKGRIGENIHGPHDSAHCGMCKKLGYDCSLRSRGLFY